MKGYAKSLLNEVDKALEENHLRKAIGYLRAARELIEALEKPKVTFNGLEMRQRLGG